jgi:hypothetical protein
MTGPPKIEANRRNTEKSTGPRTTEGKAIVAQNAVEHGLLARTAVRLDCGFRIADSGGQARPGVCEAAGTNPVKQSQPAEDRPCETKPTEAAGVDSAKQSQAGERVCDGPASDSVRVALS